MTISLVLDDIASFRNIDTVQELSDILVPHPADLLDIGRRLRHILQTVAIYLDLILHAL